MTKLTVKEKQKIYEGLKRQERKYNFPLLNKSTKKPKGKEK